MKRAFGSVLTALALAGPLSAPVTAQLPCGTFTGGSSFATTMSGCLTYSSATGLLTLTITNVGSGAGEIFAAIGIVNVQGLSVSNGSTSLASRFAWLSTSQFSGSALPGNGYAWVANPPPPHKGLHEGETATFSFNIGANLAAGSYQNVGFGVHAISGPDDCSTKFAVWNGGQSQTMPGNEPEEVACRSVPEPGSMALLATGLAALAFVAARRREDAELIDDDGEDAA